MHDESYFHFPNCSMPKSFYLVYLILCLVLNAISLAYQYSLKRDLKNNRKLQIMLRFSMGISLFAAFHAIALYLENRAGTASLLLYSVWMALICVWGGILSKKIKLKRKKKIAIKITLIYRYAYRENIVC